MVIGSRECPVLHSHGVIDIEQDCSSVQLWKALLHSVSIDAVYRQFEVKFLNIH